MPKLTLSVNAAVAARAKRYARKHGISVSEMVEIYLASVSQPGAPSAAPPVLRSLRGILKKANPRTYKRHLAEKYR